MGVLRGLIGWSNGGIRVYEDLVKEKEMVKGSI